MPVPYSATLVEQALKVWAATVGGGILDAPRRGQAPSLQIA